MTQRAAYFERKLPFQKHYQRLILGVLSLSAYVRFTPKKVVNWIISNVRNAPKGEILNPLTPRTFAFVA